MYMKKYVFLAASALALASCSSDDFLGDTQGSTPTSANSAINFGGDAGKITRTSNSGTTAQMLDGQFLVYGVKKTNDKILHNVFVNYSVWDVEPKNTTSNTSGWEYVGASGATGLGTGNITLSKEQTIKYWDYSASVYYFVAGSPINAFKYNTSTDLTTGTDIKTATVTGLAGHIEAKEAGQALVTKPVYIAAPVKIAKDDYQKPVEFTFIRQQSMVRVGIYETIPGYSITDIKFYAYDDNGDLKVTDKNNIILTSGTADYFVGGSNVEGTITYNWAGTTPSYTYAYSKTGLTKDKNWYAGKMGTLATTSAGTKIKLGDGTEMELLWGTDKDMSPNGYFTVIPTPSATEAAPILIKCDYTLISDDDSGETIKVTGATAAIPAAFSKLEANTRYTYLFKISDNTNGYTGDDPKKAGLYPITFAAVVKGSTDAMQGTVTTVSTPSITTYQAGSVTDNGIEYKSGTPITVKVTNPTDGTDLALNETENTVGKVAVYKLTKERTEADLQLASVIKTELISENKQTITLGEENKSFTFTPSATAATTETTYYAIQYLTTVANTENNTPAAYTYKVVKVVTPATTTE